MHPTRRLARGTGGGIPANRLAFLGVSTDRLPGTAMGTDPTRTAGLATTAYQVAGLGIVFPFELMSG